MGDEQHAAAKIVEQRFQPFDRGKIQVVGRLVQQQHVRLGHQRLRQRHALAHAAGKRPYQRIRVKFQPLDGGLDARLHRPTVLRFQLRLQRLHRRQQGVVIGIRLGQLVRQMMVCGDDPVQLAEPARDLVEHRCLGIQHRLLADVTDAHAGRAPDDAVIQRGLRSQHFQHAGLAAAVAPDQADALALVELECDMVEQGYMAVSKRGVIKRQVWHQLFPGLTSIFRSAMISFEWREVSTLSYTLLILPRGSIRKV